MMYEYYMGVLDLIIGPMFSGKSTMLISKGENYKIIGKRVAFINSIKDTRSKVNFGHYKDIKLGNISTHNNESIACYSCKTIDEIEPIKDEYDVFAIDEGQFFHDLSYAVKLVNDDNKVVIIAGLDGDFQQNKFGSIIDLIPQCDTLLKVHALCRICNNGTLAPFSKRLSSIHKNQQEVVGGCHEYMSVCRHHLT